MREVPTSPSLKTETSKPLVGALVLTYNNGETLAECLSSLLGQSYENLHVIVVDNASQDNLTGEIFRRFSDSCIILRSNRNGGTGSRNVGIRRALELGCELIFVTDGDTVMDQTLIETLVTLVLDEPIIGIAGASCYENNKGELAPVVVVNPRTAEIQIKKYVKERSETMAVGSALISRRVFSRIGLYNPAYFAYYEDADICLRAIREGFKVIIHPKARFHHYPATSVKHISGLRGLLSIRNRFVFVRSTQPPRNWVYFFAFHPFVLLRTLGLFLLSGQKREVQMALVGYASGILYLLRGKESAFLKSVFESLLEFRVSFA